ncbi:S8 family serine peptidase [Luteirhabdus pelagi]|uniref:S8 family serine peptidase n=1 Tax=Luteirhabdus pelagi TaxID=2792783 RepID=UPI00193A5934|nr:S8 family serine peptidase [Luteirhabdus pelagi]
MKKFNMLKVLLLSAIIFISSNAIAQQTNHDDTISSLKVFKKTSGKRAKSYNKIIDKNDTERLSQLYVTFQEQEIAAKRKAEQYALIQNIPLQRSNDDGSYDELMAISDDGFPLYYSLHNVAAAVSTRANYLNSGGGLGLNLNGDDMTAHVWDGGPTRTTHQEFDGAGGTNRVAVNDGVTTLTGNSYHAQHVTGTIVASGAYSLSKGMAWQADALTHEWNNDLSEATTAAANGMLLSNHSYGYIAADLPDWAFGAYLTSTANWDNLMYNAPYYLMVVSAGNDGNDNSSNASPMEGLSAYDKLSGNSVAKNNLVIANAQDASIDGSGNLISVSRNGSSSEGPTDDYRIKPDLTGNGTSLLSCLDGSDTQYANLTGTSMAAPNVTGTLLLLQEHFDNLNGSFMRAATLKGLALHTADDIAASGPDAQTGWGLLNAKKAAETISAADLDGNAEVEELTLTNGQTYQVVVDASGTEDLMASISWTDPAGTAVGGTNTTTAMLVNDLDIEITQSTTTYLPWRLNSVTTNGTGDNSVDPYERVDVSGASGSYIITVTHKGSLSSGSQDFSLIITGGKLATCPSITTFTGGSWNNGADDIAKRVVIDDDYNTSLDGDIEACSFTLKAGNTLRVTSADHLRVDGDITVESGATLIIEHEGSLVQIDDSAIVTNNGTIEVQKTTPFLNARDFMIMGSPMTAETRNGVYTDAIMVRNHITTNFVPNPSVASMFPSAENFADDNGDNWTNYSGAINAGEGYLVRPQNTPTESGSYDLTYTQGTLNNGIVSFSITYNGNSNASPNILGNPYASAIDADAFLAQNSMIDALYFWEHVTAPNPTYPGYNVNNYDMGDISMYNSLGGVPAANGGATPTQYIASGQGFGVKATAAGTAVFNNSMRIVGNNNTYRAPVSEANRLWLNVFNDNHELGSTMLVGYTEDGTSGYDSQYDSKRLATAVSLYSFSEGGKELAIQGRSTFDEMDEVQLGFSTQIESEEEYRIAIRDVMGDDISAANIWIIDHYAGEVVNLSEAGEYTFISHEGTFNDRFTLLYREKSLDVAELSAENAIMVPNPSSKYVSIMVPQSTIEEVTIYDVMGRVVLKEKTSGSQHQMDISNLQAATYFVRINTAMGSVTKQLLKK